MTIVIPSSSAEIMTDPARFLEDIRAGHVVYVADLGRIVALEEADDEVEDMVSLRSEKTGIDNTIFISTKGYARHAPRIKIAVDPPHTFNATAKAASMAIHDYSITAPILRRTSLSRQCNSSIAIARRYSTIGNTTSTQRSSSHG